MGSVNSATIHCTTLEYTATDGAISEKLPRLGSVEKRVTKFPVYSEGVFKLDSTSGFHVVRSRWKNLQKLCQKSVLLLGEIRFFPTSCSILAVTIIL